jgi:capsid portal protein
LDPLTNSTFLDVCSITAEDFFSTGNGYLEVVRQYADDKIVGLHWFPSFTMFVYDEGDGQNWHYEQCSVGVAQYAVPKFARYSDNKGFETRMGIQRAEGAVTYSEVIHLKQPTPLNQWYGLPLWLSAVSSIELMQALDQREFDFFLNRGVPDYILAVTGAKADDPSWTAVTNAMAGMAGTGNAHKSLALNLPEPEAKVAVFPLDVQGTDQGARFQAMTDMLSLKIVSAHGVPPLLAGIQISGKLAANNELPNAIRSFQILVIAPAQEVFETGLEQTLGNAKKNSGLFSTTQKAKKFNFKQIDEELKLDQMATSASGGADQARQAAAAAVAGRVGTGGKLNDQQPPADAGAGPGVGA